MSDFCKKARRAERRAVPKPACIPSGAEAGHGESSGFTVPAEGQQLSLPRGLQGRSVYSLNEGHHV